MKMNQLRERIEMREIASTIQVTDNVVVTFSGGKKSESFKLVILNDGNQNIEIEDVKVDLKIIVPRNDDFNGIIIRPCREFSLIFDILRHYNEIDTTARVRIFFTSCTVTRWIKIIYNEGAFIRRQAHDIQRKKYPIPREFFDIMDSVQSYNERMHALDALDALIPVTEDLNFNNYSDYFHGLLYLEQMGMERNFRIYNRQEVFLRHYKNNYEMNVDDLFETRPSLRVGKFEKFQLNIKLGK